VLTRTPAWATEQIEHSWLGNLELSVCTWTAWTIPVKATSRIHNKDRPTTHLSLRELYPGEIKSNALLRSQGLDIPRLAPTMHATTARLSSFQKQKGIDSTIVKLRGQSQYLARVPASDSPFQQTAVLFNVFNAAEPLRPVCGRNYNHIWHVAWPYTTTDCQLDSL
jgi:hypothetical protein